MRLFLCLHDKHHSLNLQDRLWAPFVGIFNGWCTSTTLVCLSCPPPFILTLLCIWRFRRTHEQEYTIQCPVGAESNSALRENHYIAHHLYPTADPGDDVLSPDGHIWNQKLIAFLATKEGQTVMARRLVDPRQSSACGNFFLGCGEVQTPKSIESARFAVGSFGRVAEVKGLIDVHYTSSTGQFNTCDDPMSDSVWRSYDRVVLICNDADVLLLVSFLSSDHCDMRCNRLSQMEHDTEVYEKINRKRRLQALNSMSRWRL